jgi:hypothetical protein
VATVGVISTACCPTCARVLPDMLTCVAAMLTHVNYCSQDAAHASMAALFTRAVCSFSHKVDTDTSALLLLLLLSDLPPDPGSWW